MSSFWLFYLEISRKRKYLEKVLFLHYYYSIQGQTWEEYLLSMRLMMPWMSAYDSMHYGRYLPLYWSSMKDLPADKPSFMKAWIITVAGIFTVSFTWKPLFGLPYLTDQFLCVNVALSILILAIKKRYSSFLKRVCVFQKICFKIKILKTHKTSSDCYIKRRSLKWRAILISPNTIF